MTGRARTVAPQMPVANPRVTAEKRQTRWPDWSNANPN